MDVLALRPIPAAGVFLSLTRRCPLTCEHCSTNSLLTSEEHAAEPFLRFVSTFRPDDRPELVLMTGGEALLRPHLVREIADRARAAGSASYLISGMFFAESRRIPPLLRRAIDAVDHFAASLDIFHERQVSRAAVLDVLRELVEEGRDVSVQVVGLDDDDPYLAEVTQDIRERLDERVPVLVGRVDAVGRAAAWFERPRGAGTAEVDRVDPFPCTLAGWPVVSYDGSILACCNQMVVDGHGGEHLRLGHAARDGWSEIRRRTTGDATLRAIRLVGPQYAAARHGGGRVSCSGYCATCYRLSEDPDLQSRLRTLMQRRTTRALETEARRLELDEGPVGFVRRFGVGRYAELVTLGYGAREAACTA